MYINTVTYSNPIWFVKAIAGFGSEWAIAITPASQDTHFLSTDRLWVRQPVWRHWWWPLWQPGVTAIHHLFYFLAWLSFIYFSSIGDSLLIISPPFQRWVVPTEKNKGKIISHSANLNDNPRDNLLFIALSLTVTAFHPLVFWFSQES